MLKRILFLIVMLTVAGKAFASTPEKYSYVVVLGNDTAIEITDSLFYSISRKVIFPVNKYVIPENSEFRRELTEELMPYMNDNSYRLQSVMIRGAASPEGPYNWNVTLSQRRTKALLDLLSENSSTPLDGKVNTVEVPEDYIYLLLLLKERNDKDYERVAEIVNKWIDVDQRQLKAELRRLDNQRVWYRLLRDYYPEMRASRVVLIFKRYLDLEEQVMEPANITETEAPAVDAFARIPVNVRLPRRELLSVKTNLLFDFAYMPGGYNRFCPIPNIAVEYYPLYGHFTYGASIDFPWWQDYDAHKYFQVRNYQLESRYYFRSGDVRERGHGNGAAYQGWYLQAYGHLGLYGICFDEKRGWEGEGIGGGLGFGYVMPLTKSGHWRLEFGAQFGFFWTKHDPFQYECPVDPTEDDDLYYYKWTGDADLFKKRQHRFTWFGPTRIGVTLSYDLLYRNRTKRGASFKSWE